MCVCRSASGSCIVTPRARPRGTIVTLCSGSAWGSIAATSAWPASWYAQFTRSFSRHHERPPLDAHQHLVARRVEVSPRHDRAPPCAAASSAASLTRLARSAPEKPGVPRAIGAQVHAGRERHLARVHLEDRLPPLHVGRADRTWRSKRPGRSSAGSRIPAGWSPRSRRSLVGGEPVHLDEQLIERLFTLLVAQGWPPRLRPTASSSSMNTMHAG